MVASHLAAAAAAANNNKDKDIHKVRKKHLCKIVRVSDFLTKTQERTKLIIMINYEIFRFLSLSLHKTDLQHIDMRVTKL